MGEATKTQLQPAVDDEALLCPFCGYDLRGSSGERCSECGQVIDRELAHSAIPWVHRRYIGRVRGYVKTVWMVTSGTASLRREGRRPQALHEARRFRAVTAVVIWLGLLAVLVHIAPKSLQMLQRFPQQLRYPTNGSPWTDDVFVPWAAGASRWYFWPLMLLGLAVYLSGAPARLFYVNEKERAESARAIGYYAASVLTWTTPILFLQLTLFALEGGFFLRWNLGLTMGMIITMVAWLLLISTRMIQWSIRVRGAKAVSALMGVPYLWTWWSWGFVIWLGIVPWCVGWVWIVVDSSLQ
jgi:hypothetical protein